MTKKETLAPLLFIFLAILFATICAMVFLSKGKSAKWVSWKMKIGGLLLTLGSFTNGIAQEPKISCYLIDIKKTIIKRQIVELIIPEHKDPHFITRIKNNNNPPLSFFVLNEKKDTIQKGKTLVADITRDDRQIYTKIRIFGGLFPGKYYLHLFYVPEAGQAQAKPGAIIPFYLKDDETDSSNND